MRFSCLHSHSVFSDGKDDIETMCQAAYDKGLAAIGFSSHAPFAKTGIPSDWHLLESRVDEYFQALSQAKMRGVGRVPVLSGLVVDYIKGLIGPGDDEFQAWRKEGRLEYIIASAHFVWAPGKEDVFAVDSSPDVFERKFKTLFKGDGEVLAETYYQAVCDMCKDGGFEILGHFDLLKKNNEKLHFFDETSPRCRNAAASAVEAAKAAGAIVEMNTGGMNRGYTREPYPSPFILKLLAAAHVPLSINSDAHCAADLDAHYYEALQAALDAGYHESDIVITF
jgi:histidinol-phosphatase (PHP family)